MPRISRYKDFVNELRSQLTIPFKEKQFKGKSVHGHLEDALIDLKAGDPKTYFSKSNPEAEIEKWYEKTLERVVDDPDYPDTTTDYVYNFLYTYDPNDEDYKEYYNWKEIEDALKDDEDYLDGNHHFDLAKYLSENTRSVKDIFTEDGYKEFMKISRQKFEEDTQDMQYTVKDGYDKDEDGLIDCWRTVAYTAGSEKDVYLNIMKHGGVGVYWAWDEDKAEAYWGESGGYSITLHGKVSVEDVDWSETLYRSAYGLKEEREIRMNDGGKILILGYHDDEIDKFIQFEEPYLVKVGSD